MLGERLRKHNIRKSSSSSLPQKRAPAAPRRVFCCYTLSVSVNNVFQLIIETLISCLLFHSVGCFKVLARQTVGSVDESFSSVYTLESTFNQSPPRAAKEVLICQATAEDLLINPIRMTREGDRQGIAGDSLCYCALTGVTRELRTSTNGEECL